MAIITETGVRTNEAHVLTLGVRLLNEATAREIVVVWLAHHLTGERHRRRVEKIRDIERRHLWSAG